MGSEIRNIFSETQLKAASTQESEIPIFYAHIWNILSNIENLKPWPVEHASHARDNMVTWLDMHDLSIDNMVHGGVMPGPY